MAAVWIGSSPNDKRAMKARMQGLTPPQKEENINMKVKDYSLIMGKQVKKG